VTTIITGYNSGIGGKLDVKRVAAMHQICFHLSELSSIEKSPTVFLASDYPAIFAPTLPFHLSMLVYFQ